MICVFVSRARTGWVDSSTAAILSGFQLVASVGSSGGGGGGWLFLFAAVMVVYHTEGDVSLPRYGPLRSDAILWYVQIVYHSSTLCSCIWWGCLV